MVYRRKAGHPGGSFSAAEILAALYFHHLDIDPARPTLAGTRPLFAEQRPCGGGALLGTGAARVLPPGRPERVGPPGRAPARPPGPHQNARRRDVVGLSGTRSLDCGGISPGAAAARAALSHLCVDERRGYAVRRGVGRRADRRQVQGQRSHRYHGL